MGVIIQLRRDTAANWNTVNPVLHSGELGVEIDTGHAKLGDGSSHWAQLSYWSTSALVLALSGGAMTGWLSPAVVRLTDAATILVDASQGNDFRVTITANRTMGVPSNPRDGQIIMFDVTQGGSGGWQITWPSAYSFGSGQAPSLSIAAGDTDLVGFKYNADKAKWLYTGAMTGY